jgi:hypothetical protein
VAPDLPTGDDSAGLADYVDVAVDAIGVRRDLVLVAQSMAGFIAPLVCDRVPVDLMVLVAAMVPKPGETGHDWWVNTGHERAMRDQAERDGRPVGDELDPIATFLHDVPADVVAASAEHVTPQSGTPFDLPWPLDAWPDVPTRFLLCRDDRFFPADFQRRIVKERLGIAPDEMPGGHLPALAHPDELVRRVEAYRIRSTAPGPTLRPTDSVSSTARRRRPASRWSP